MWFRNVNTKEEAKKIFRNLAKVYHPDAGNLPNGEIFVEITEQYKELLKELENPAKEKKTAPPPPKEPKPPKKPQVVDVVEFEPPPPRFTPKQKKHLVRGAGLLFNVFAAKFVDRIN